MTAVRHPVRHWEVLDVDKALRRVWHVCTRSEYGVLPSESRLGPVGEKRSPALSLSTSESALQCPLLRQHLGSVPPGVFAIPQRTRCTRGVHAPGAAVPAGVHRAKAGAAQRSCRWGWTRAAGWARVGVPGGASRSATVSRRG
jgi:hypothetical protein